MKSLRDILRQTQEDGVAIGHFNISDLVLLKAAFAAAQELKVPVLVGASEGEREFMGVRQIAALVRSLREDAPESWVTSEASGEILRDETLGAEEAVT